MIRRLYTFLMYCLLPYIVLRLLLKSRREKAYRQRMSERFSFGRSQPKAVDVWLHAVSMGEVVAATPLIERMLAAHLRVLVTTMTPTGSQQVLTRFKSQVSHQYIPYDLPFCLRRFFKRAQPRVGIIMETELWPNMLYCADRMQIPLLLVNARLSDKAFAQYQRIDYLMAPIVSLFKWIGAQSEQDVERYTILGAVPSTIEMTGNMKFDLSFTRAPLEIVHQLKAAWGATRTVWIAASTHENEELQLLSQLSRIKASIPDLIVLIAPRRPERFQLVYELVQAQAWRTGLRSKPETVNLDTDVIILDSMGELMAFYEDSDYAFVGGSLVPIGGHNVLEPIALQVPVVCGPFMQNAKSICAELVEHQAIYQGQSAEDLADKIIEMHQNPEQRRIQVSNASAVLEANRGTVDRYWNKIEVILADSILRNNT